MYSIFRILFIDRRRAPVPALGNSEIEQCPGLRDKSGIGMLRLEGRIRLETSERASGKLNIKHQVPLDERGSRPAEFCLDAIVHLSGAFAVVSCYTGKLKVVMVESGEVVNIQIPELNLLSFTFLPLVNEEEQHAHTYAVALLHLDYQEHNQLISRTFTISSDTGPELDSTAIDVECSSHFFSPTLISFKNVPTPDEGGVYLIPVDPADIQMKVKVVRMRRKKYSSEESLWLEEVGF